LGEGDSVLSKERARSISSKERYCKNVKMGWGHLKIFSSKTTGPFLTVGGRTFQFVQTKGIAPLQGESKNILKFKKKKNFFSRTSKPNSIKLGTNYPWVKRIQFCSNKGPGPLQRGDNHKNEKMGWGHLKILLQNHWANFIQTWHISSLG
jgi:hypothetical protein